MEITKKVHTGLQEKMFTNTLSSGAKCYIIPKKGYMQKQAAVMVPFGSNTIKWTNAEQNDSIPEGTAHFIEHKLFEKKEGDIFTKFSKNGANANAFTDFNKTAYYFSCTDHFEENLITLLNMAQEPYFTEEGTEKEKSIIAQEIRMYGDDAGWIVFFNLLNGVYHNHPIRNNIAGTVESIQNITASILQDTYQTFYAPENLSIVCVGDIAYKDCIDICEKTLKSKKNVKVVLQLPQEPQAPVTQYIEKKMSISQPIFNIGFKHQPDTTTYSIKKITGMKILSDFLTGEASALYAYLSEKNLLHEPMGYEYLTGAGYSLSVFSGRSDAPRDVFSVLVEEIEHVKKASLSKEVFARLLKKHTGRFIRGLNSIDAITMSQLEYASRDCDIIAAYDALKNTEQSYVESLLKEEFSIEHATLSAIVPTN